MTAHHYPLTVALPGGQVRHTAMLVGDGPGVATLCRKRGTPVGDGAGLPYCAACNSKPNPISQQGTRGAP